MEKRSIWTEVKAPLELHEDDRGKIVDIFYKENINHVNTIISKKGALRGNHYHKQTVQHILMISGSMKYWYKALNSDEPAKFVVLKKGDLVTTPPNEIHTLKILEEDTTFMAFSSGLRGGKDYESDTFRVDSIL